MRLKKFYKEYVFIPSDKSGIRYNFRNHKFRYKKDLMNYLRGNSIEEVINGVVRFSITDGIREFNKKSWGVWLNPNKVYNEPFLFRIKERGEKMFNKSKLSKLEKTNIAYGNKIITLMISIHKEITSAKANNLYDLFIRTGYIDFIPSEDDLVYINGYIGDGIDFCYWSDRCGDDLRRKTILTYFKRGGFLNEFNSKMVK